jgi:hypothetical protein
MNKKNKTTIKHFSLFLAFFLSVERDVIYRIISQCSTIVDEWNVFEDKKTVMFFSSSSSSFFLRAFYISMMFSTTKKKKKKSLFSSFIPHMFFEFSVPCLHPHTYSPCFFLMRTKKKREKRRHSTNEQHYDLQLSLARVICRFLYIAPTTNASKDLGPSRDLPHPIRQ